MFRKDTLTDQERTLRAIKGWYWVRERHGSLFDRGAADSYYHRGSDPHYGGVGGDSGPRVTNLTEEEVAEYAAGYEFNERYGDKKSWD